MKFEDWWQVSIVENPLWKLSDENLNWRDVKVIAKLAYLEGEHHEFEKQINASIKSKKHNKAL